MKRIAGKTLNLILASAMAFVAQGCSPRHLEYLPNGQKIPHYYHLSNYGQWERYYENWGGNHLEIRKSKDCVLSPNESREIAGRELVDVFNVNVIQERDYGKIYSDKNNDLKVDYITLFDECKNTKEIIQNNSVGKDAIKEAQKQFDFYLKAMLAENQAMKNEKKAKEQERKAEERAEIERKKANALAAVMEN